MLIEMMQCENTILDVKRLNAFRCCICNHGRCDNCRLEKIRRGGKGEVKSRIKGLGGAFWEKCEQIKAKEEGEEEEVEL